MKKNKHRGAIAALALAASALAAHAHGDELHGDEPHAVASAAGIPRIEAATETFELVGRLENDALTLFINRFETSEPVLQATVETESGEHKAVAVFRADQGSYVVSDPKFLRALGQAGSHPLVVTVTAGQEADLLEATLDVTAAERTGRAGKLPQGTAWAGLLGLGVLGVLGAGGFVLRKKRANNGDTP